MHLLKIICLATGFTLGTTDIAFTQTVNGWCFAPDPCAGIIEIRDGRFDTCEESCTLEPRETLAGGGATMHRLHCRRDGAPDVQAQALMIPYSGNNDYRFFVTDHQTQVLHRCGTEASFVPGQAGPLHGPDVVRQLFEERSYSERLEIQERLTARQLFSGPNNARFSVELYLSLWSVAQILFGPDADIDHPKVVQSVFDEILAGYAHMTENRYSLRAM